MNTRINYHREYQPVSVGDQVYIQEPDDAAHTTPWKMEMQINGQWVSTGELAFTLKNQRAVNGDGLLALAATAAIASGTTRKVSRRQLFGLA